MLDQYTTTEVVSAAHFTSSSYIVDISLVRYPHGHYRVLVNYLPCGSVRSRGYLTSRGFRDNQDKAARNHYNRVVAEFTPVG